MEIFLCLLEYGVRLELITISTCSIHSRVASLQSYAIMRGRHRLELMVISMNTTQVSHHNEFSDFIRKAINCWR